MFPPSLLPPTLAMVGLFQTKGPILPVVEMQGRWAVRVFAGTSECGETLLVNQFVNQFVCFVSSLRPQFSSAQGPDAGGDPVRRREEQGKVGSPRGGSLTELRREN